MEPQPPSPSERRWVATFPDGVATVVRYDDDSWAVYDADGTPASSASDTPGGRILWYAQYRGWPRLPGWSLPAKGFDDPGIYVQLHLIGAEVVEGPSPLTGEPMPTDGTIIG